MMSKNSKLVLSSLAIIAASVGLFYGLTVPSFLNDYSVTYTDLMGVRHIETGDPAFDNIPYHGVVHAVFKHADGKVYETVTSHNTRTVQGINCLEQIMFNGLSPGPLNTNGTNVCGFQSGSVLTSAKFNGFRFIGVINQTTARNAITLNGSDTVATSKIGGTRTSGNHGIIFTASQGLPVNSTVAGTATYNQITITSTAIPFTGDSATGSNICGAVLLNSTSSSTNALFAENSFTCVSLANTDTLTITWTITVT